MRVRLLAATAALLTGLTSCTGNGGEPGAGPTTRSTGVTSSTVATSTSADPGPSSTAPSTPVRLDGPVVLGRSGGLTGRQDTITIEPDGRWSLVDRAGGRRTGALTPAQLARLGELVRSPAFAADMAGPAATVGCPDGFTYTLTMGDDRQSFADCVEGPARQEAALAVVELLTTATR